MVDLYKGKSSEMKILTQKYVTELIQIWTRIFDDDICMENLNKLVEHATNFYEELVAESREKEEYVRSEIRELQNEAENLKRLLKVDIVVQPREDAPLLVAQAELDNNLVELRESLRVRREQVYELLLEQESLCDELCEPPRPLLFDPLPTADDIEEFRNHLVKLQEEHVERLHKVLKLRMEIKEFLTILELKVPTETEDRLLNQKGIKLSKETFAGLNRLHKFYGSQVQEVREKIDEMKGKLKDLWDRLDTSPNTRNKFMRFTEYTQTTFDAFYGELNRCQSLKSQNIKMYVNQIREEIVQWWDKTLKSELQRNRFTNFHSKCYTDDLLVLHEMELEDLKLYYESNKEIFELYANRKILWERMTALEAKATEPGRFNNRGGQLLKEEKERKTIATKLPKIEQQITELVKRFEEREQKHFLVYGQNILDVMAMEWEQKRQAKEQLSTARKQAQTPNNKTHLAGGRTPMSSRNLSTASTLRNPSAATPNQSTLSLAKKRKLSSTAEKLTPVAKRSLFYAMNSPSVFLKPTSTAVKTPYKSPLKKTRVLGTMIRRRSARRSAGGSKKHRSINKAQQPNIDSEVSSYHHDNYDAFEKFIEPASRSSIKPQSFNSTSILNNSKRIRKVGAENIFARSTQPLLRKTAPRIASPNTISSLRKLTTKNLPIMI